MASAVEALNAATMATPMVPDFTYAGSVARCYSVVRQNVQLEAAGSPARERAHPFGPLLRSESTKLGCTVTNCVSVRFPRSPGKTIQIYARSSLSPLHALRILPLPKRRRPAQEPRIHPWAVLYSSFHGKNCRLRVRNGVLRVMKQAFPPPPLNEGTAFVKSSILPAGEEFSNVFRVSRSFNDIDHS